MPTVVTGANRGVGAAILKELRARGIDTIGTSRTPTNNFMTADVSKKDSVDALAQQLDGQSVPLLVCNAGVLLDRNEELADGYAPESWASCFEVNVTGVFLTVQALLPQLQQAAADQGSAKIAIISSVMGSSARPVGGTYIYRASKAAATNVGRNLAKDLHDLGIAVGIYHPGWVRTDMGGPSADISESESATGLVDQFEALSLETTGCFLNWDGAGIDF
jgi:NAD(P)-dependent dehydrogenase (short-subunit alcohol dehydrogenase family)